MKAHCSWCAGHEAAIGEQRRKIAHLLRIAEKSPGTAVAKGSLAQIPEAKQRIASDKRVIAEHLAETSAPTP